MGWELDARIRVRLPTGPVTPGLLCPPPPAPRRLHLSATASGPPGVPAAESQHGARAAAEGAAGAEASAAGHDRQGASSTCGPHSLGAAPRRTLDSPGAPGRVEAGGAPSRPLPPLLPSGLSSPASTCRLSPGEAGPRGKLASLLSTFELSFVVWNQSPQSCDLSRSVPVPLSHGSSPEATTFTSCFLGTLPMSQVAAPWGPGSTPQLPPLPCPPAPPSSLPQS